MNSKIKQLVAGAALAGALTVGTAGAAFAADSPAAPTSPSTPSAQAGKRHPALRIAIRRGVVKVVTDTLGVTREDLRTALKSGQTLSAYTQSLGKDPQTVVDALTKAANEKIDQLVANGKLQQSRADTMKSKLPQRIDTLMNHQFGQHGAV